MLDGVVIECGKFCFENLGVSIDPLSATARSNPYPTGTRSITLGASKELAFIENRWVRGRM